MPKTAVGTTNRKQTPRSRSAAVTASIRRMLTVHRGRLHRTIRCTCFRVIAPYLKAASQNDTVHLFPSDRAVPKGGFTRCDGIDCAPSGQRLEVARGP